MNRSTTFRISYFYQKSNIFISILCFENLQNVCNSVKYIFATSFSYITLCILALSISEILRFNYYAEFYCNDTLKLIYLSPFIYFLSNYLYLFPDELLKEFVKSNIHRSKVDGY